MNALGEEEEVFLTRIQLARITRRNIAYFNILCFCITTITHSLINHFIMSSSQTILFLNEIELSLFKVWVNTIQVLPYSYEGLFKPSIAIKQFFVNSY